MAAVQRPALAGSGVFGVSGGRGGARGRNFVRIDFRFPNVSHAFFDHQFAGANVAEQFGLGFDFDFFPGVDVAVDLAADHHRLRVDVAVDDGAVAELQGAVGVNFPFQFAVQRQFAGELDVAFDFNIRVQYVFR